MTNAREVFEGKTVVVTEQLYRIADDGTEKLIEEKISVREAERIAKTLSEKKDKQATQAKTKAPKSYKTVARALSDSLGTDVKIKSTQGRNRIELTFKDEADLERLFRLMVKK